MRHETIICVSPKLQFTMQQLKFQFNYVIPEKVMQKQGRKNFNMCTLESEKKNIYTYI